MLLGIGVEPERLLIHPQKALASAIHPMRCIDVAGRGIHLAPIPIGFLIDEGRIRLLHAVSPFLSDLVRITYWSIQRDALFERLANDTLRDLPAVPALAPILKTFKSVWVI